MSRIDRERNEEYRQDHINSLLADEYESSSWRPFFPHDCIVAGCGRRCNCPADDEDGCLKCGPCNAAEAEEERKKFAMIIAGGGC